MSIAISPLPGQARGVIQDLSSGTLTRRLRPRAGRLRDQWLHRRELALACELVPSILASLPAEVVGGGQAAWRMGRAEWTETGVAVVRVGAPGEPPAALLKLSCAPEGVASLRRQDALLARLHADQRLGDWRGVLPASLATGARAEHWYVLEKAVPGRDMRGLVSAAPARARAHAAAAAAIGQLHRRSASLVTLGDQLLEQWVDQPLELVGEATGRTAAVQRLGLELRDALAGRRVSVGWIHGDFWPGNVLVGPDGATVTGIVDWDLASPADLPLHDVLNLVLSTSWLVEGLQLGDAVRARLDGAGWTPQERALLEPVLLPLGPETTRDRVMLLLYWLRFVATYLSKCPEQARDTRWLTRNVHGVLTSVERSARVVWPSVDPPVAQPALADCPPPSDVAAAAPVAPLRLPNLLNDFASLAGLLPSELRRGSRLDAFLLAAGMNQIVEDYLHPDPFFLNRLAGRLDQLHHPAGRGGARAARTISTAVARARGQRPAVRRLQAWQLELASLVQRLADSLVGPAPSAAEQAPDDLVGTAPSAAEQAQMIRSAETLVAACANFPPGLRREVLRLPACFRGFDQQPADLERLAREFAQRWPDRSVPLLVVGLRTSGSYLAPLYVAYLQALGFQSVASCTLRPGRRLLSHERAALRRVTRAGGRVLLVDDPPVSGGSLAEAAAELELLGVPRASLVLLLQVFGSSGRLPERLSAYSAVVLPFKEWTVHERLRPAAVARTLADLLGPGVGVSSLEPMHDGPTGSGRGHVRAVYRADLIDKATGGRREQLIAVEGTGLGYFGEQSLAVAKALKGWLPPVYGARAGLLYRAWLPEEQQLRTVDPGQEPSVAAAVAAYVHARHQALGVDQDTSLRLSGQFPAWEVASTILSRAFGRAWLGVRIPLVDPVVRRLLRVERPSVIDGSMGLSHWFAASQEGLVKVDFASGSFPGHGAELTCYDPLYDLASLLASWDASSLAPSGRAAALARELRAAYARLARQPVGPERWLVYQIVRLWALERHGVDARRQAQRATARAFQRYFAERYFAETPTRAEGPVCALDVDGVLEGSLLGAPALTPSSAAALRALVRHGFRPVLATGRSLAEVQERCAAYGLTGGVAEYGAVIYNHASGQAKPLLSPVEHDALDALRAVLGETAGVHFDPDYGCVVRAYRLESAGRRRGLPPAMAAAAIERSGTAEHLRAVPGEAQTDFVPLGCDKGRGLRALLADLGLDCGAANTPLAFAVGDTLSDLPMLALAAQAYAPGHADPQVRRAGVTVLRQPYQAGLASAVARLLGHRPGGCRVCQQPPASTDARRLDMLLAAQEAGTWSMLRSALRLAAELAREKR